MYPVRQQYGQETINIRKLRIGRDGQSEAYDIS